MPLDLLWEGKSLDRNLSGDERVVEGKYLVCSK